MQVLRSHPLVLGVSVAIICALAGLAALERTRSTPTPTTGSWGNSGGYLPPTPLTDTPIEPSITNTRTVPPQNPGTTTSFYIPPSTSTPSSEIQSGVASEFNQLMAQIQGNIPKKASTSAQKLLNIVNPFTYFSEYTPTAAGISERTPEQQALFNYGNTVGSYIRTFDTNHPTMVDILGAQAKDRTNPTKAAALRAVGDGYRALGEQIRSVPGVPAAMQSANDALAASYIDLGTKLSQVSATTDDKSFIAAITTYNSSVETFTRAYIAIATLLSVNNVRFSETDRGSVFSFQGKM